jgi:hypothetical protein
MCPADVIERDRVIGHTRTPVLKKYERICFDREQRTLYGKPTADLVHPGHPLMAAVTDLVLSSHRSLLKRGAVLVDPHDDSTQPKACCSCSTTACAKAQRPASPWTCLADCSLWKWARRPSRRRALCPPP